MKEISEKDLEVALRVGDAICSELNVSCSDRGRIAFIAYKALQTLKPENEDSVKPEPDIEQP
jgi:hypothetical protein